MKRAELVFIPVPGLSHLVSTLEFAKRLLDRDDRILVTILVIKPPFPPSIDAYTKSFAALSQTRIQIIDLPLVEPPSPELFQKSTENAISVYIENHKPHVKDIVTNIVSSHSSSDSVQVIGLVLDFFCVSMIDVANELGLPSYLFLTPSAGFLGLMLYLPTRHSQIETELKRSDPDSLIPGLEIPVPVSVLPSGLLDKDAGYAAHVKLAQRFRDTKGIIINTFSDLEPYAINTFSDCQNPPIYAVGPVLNLKVKSAAPAHPDLSQAHHGSIMNWLDNQPSASVLFLCFGSFGSFGAPQVKEIALGLDRSGVKFLWSLRPQAEDSTLEDILPEGFLEKIEGRGKICGWSPQVEILAHKAVGGFVSHCGWNSILESLWFGVPILAWPIYAEQHLNAFRMVKELGLAVEMRLDYREGSGVVMADEIERKVRCLMEGESEVRRKVEEMREKGRNAAMDGGSSFCSIGRLIEDVIGHLG